MGPPIHKCVATPPLGGHIPYMPTLRPKLTYEATYNAGVIYQLNPVEWWWPKAKRLNLSLWLKMSLQIDQAVQLFSKTKPKITLKISLSWRTPLSDLAQ